MTPNAPASADAAPAAPPLPPKRTSEVTGPGRDSGLGSYLPFLDGLRGVAIILVMLFHFTKDVELASQVGDFLFDSFAGFYLGVDIFFLVSGYLITGILIKMPTRPRSAGVFFARRALRIVPPYAFYLVSCLALLPAFREYSARNYLNDHLIWFVTYTNNFLITFEGWPASFLSHLWSLAVEEQFYVLWPFLLAVPLFQRRWLLALCIALAIGPLTRAYMAFAGVGGLGIYVLLPARMDPLVLGGLIAVCHSKGWLPRINNVLKYASIPAGVYIFVYFFGMGFNYSVFPWRFSAVAKHLATAILTGAVLTACLMGRTRMTAMFSGAFLIRVGRVSYALYLWHYFVNTMFIKKELHPFNFISGSADLLWIELYMIAYIALAGMISYLIAIVSWKFFEEPILKLKKYAAPKPVAA